MRVLGLGLATALALSTPTLAQTWQPMPNGWNGDWHRTPGVSRDRVPGGLVQGLGGAFLEHLVYDANGQLLAGNLADYLIPTATDFPKIRAIALENHRSPSNPLGVKGAGEGPIIPIGGLMANAVANALASFGATPNQLPLSPASVWHMSSAKQSTRASIKIESK